MNYTLSHQTSGNPVLVFRRSVGGTLSFAGSFPTGRTRIGKGNDRLGSQGAVALDKSTRFLFAVNAGSNDISGLAVNGDQLELINSIGSAGVMPIGIAMHGNLVYVFNAGAPRSDGPRWMLLRRLLPGVFARQSEGERACFRERSKPRARKLNGHPEHLIGLTDPLPGVPPYGAGPSGLPDDRHSILCPGDGKIPADIKGLRGPD